MIVEKDVRSSSRHALGVRRFHVWPMVQEQRVDAHTCQMLRIYCCIWGPPSPAVTWTIVWHDAGESDAGDCQFGAKRRYPALKAALDECEADQLQLLLETDVVAKTNDGDPLLKQEQQRVKACDLLDGLEHGLVDVAMGNRLAGPVVVAYRDAVNDYIGGMGEADRFDIRRYLARPYHQKLTRIHAETCA